MYCRAVRAAILLPAILGAQQAAAPDEVRVSSRPYAAPPPTIRVETKLVELNVTVRDGSGRVVRGLKQENFQVSDDGKPRAIATFSEYRAGSEPVDTAPATPSAAAGEKTGAAPASATARSRYLALFFDDMNAADGEEDADFTRAQAAATQLVKRSLPPGTEVGIFTASGKGTFDFTSDPAKLVKAIADLKNHPHFSARTCAGINPYQAYRISDQHDMETVRLVLRASATGGCGFSANQIMTQAEEIWRKAKQSSMDTFAALAHVVGYLGAKPGERVLLMTSAGFAAGSLEMQENRIIDEATHAGVVVNALVTKGLFNENSAGERFDTDPAPQYAADTARRGYQAWSKTENAEVRERPMIMDEAMSNLAHGTGGILFHNNNDLNLGFRETSVAPEVTYRMSFKPEGLVADGSYHKLKVTLAHAGSDSVETRPGYFAPSETPAEDPRSKLDREVAASDTLSDFPAGLAVQMGKPAGDRRMLRVVVRIDVAKLPFGTQGDRKTQRITFVSALLDAQGKQVAAKEGTMELALTAETYERLAKSGLNAELSFQVAPGAYGLREVVQEGVNGNVSASTNPIEVK